MPPTGRPGSMPGIAPHGLPGDGPHQRVVASQQRLEEHLRQFFGRQSIAAAASHPGAVGVTFAGLGVLGKVVEGKVGFEEPVFGTPHREVDLEDDLEGFPMRVVLDQCRTERVFERVAIFDRDVRDGLHRVEVLGERHGQARLAEFVDEPGEQIEHRRLGGIADGARAHRPPRRKLHVAHASPTSPRTSSRRWSRTL